MMTDFIVTVAVFRFIFVVSYLERPQT